MKKTYAKITTTFEDVHRFPDAPREVKFLRHPHRHTFHVTVYIQQFHNDRDIEFVLFKRWLNKTIAKKIIRMKSSKSCEMMAEKLCGEIQREYGLREVKIEVSEDNENGAVVECS